MTAQYLLFCMPGLFMYGLSDLIRRFLNSFRLNFIPMISFAISVMLHPIWMQYFVIERGQGIIGIAIAELITNSITFTILKIFKNTYGSLEETKVAFYQNSTIESKGLKEYFWIGAPFALIYFLDYWMWELMTLSAGLISVND